VVAITSTEGAEPSYACLATASEVKKLAIWRASMAYRALDQKDVHEQLRLTKITDVPGVLNSMGLGGYRITSFVGTRVSSRLFGDIVPAVRVQDSRLPADNRRVTFDDNRLAGPFVDVVLFVGEAANAVFHLPQAYAIWDGENLTKCDQRGQVEKPLVWIPKAQLSALGFPAQLVQDLREGDDFEISAELRAELERSAFLWGISVREAAWLLYD
jgi:hypothetical protein